MSSRLRRFRKLAAELRRIQLMCGATTCCEYALKALLNVGTVLRTGNLQVVDHAMGDRVRCFRFLGHKFRLKGSFGGVREICGRGVYFGLPDFTLHDGETIFDLGCNCGVFSISAAAAGCRVIAVDAQRSLLQRLAENVSLNRTAGRVTAMWALIAPDAGIFSDNGQVLRANKGYMPPVVDIPTVMQQYAVDRIHFLKVDIEGSEFPLFRAEVGWLNSVDRIAMEVHTAFGDPADIVRTLNQHGFCCCLTDAEHRPVSRLRANDGYLFASRNLHQQAFAAGVPVEERI